MNFDAIKSSILLYVNHFGMYDYIAFAWLIFTFFIALLLSIVLAKRSVLLSIFILLFALVLIGAGPFALKKVLDNYLRASNTTISLFKKLNFTNVLIINGEVNNLSKKSFSTCTLDASVYKQSTNNIKQFINQLKPIRKKSILLNKSIESNQSEEFQITFYNFDYDQDVNVSVSSECY